MAIHVGDPRGVFFDIHDDVDHAADLTARAELMRVIDKRIRDAGWTQAEAAQVLGVTQRQVSDLKNGRLSKFSIEALTEMSAAMGTTP